MVDSRADTTGAFTAHLLWLPPGVLLTPPPVVVSFACRRCWCVKWLEREEAISQVCFPLDVRHCARRLRQACMIRLLQQEHVGHCSVPCTKTVCTFLMWTFQALGKSARSDGPWELCKLGREFHETWLSYVSKTELSELTLSARQELSN